MATPAALHYLEMLPRLSQRLVEDMVGIILEAAVVQVAARVPATPQAAQATLRPRPRARATVVVVELCPRLDRQLPTPVVVVVELARPDSREYRAKPGVEAMARHHRSRVLQ